MLCWCFSCVYEVCETSSTVQVGPKNLSTLRNSEVSAFECTVEPRLSKSQICDFDICTFYRMLTVHMEQISYNQ